MALRVRFHPAAEQELYEAADWYEARLAGLGAEFRDEIERAVDVIAHSPLIWPVWPDTGSTEVRRCLLSRFPFGLAYLPAGSGLTVYAVAHLARRPGYWRARLRGEGA